MKIADAYVEIQARGASGGDGTEEARKMGKKMAKSVSDEFTKTIVEFGIGKIAVDQFRKAIDAGSGLNETVAKSSVVFGKGAAEVEKWGDKAATAMGQSKQQAMEAAATYGNLFQAFGIGQADAQKMSTSLVQLASDLASFNNTSVDDAIAALQSGLTGETEPLKRYGVALSDVRLKQEALAQGIITSTSQALTPAQKSMAAYALVMKDTALAQGDFARTSDGAANQARISAAKIQDAQADLGSNLVPVYGRVVQVVGAAAEGFSKLPSSVQVGVVALAGVAAVIGPLKRTKDAIGGLVDGFGDLPDGATKFAKGLAMAGAAIATFQIGGEIANEVNGTADKTERALQRVQIALGQLDSTKAAGAFKSLTDEIEAGFEVSSLWSDWGKRIQLPTDDATKSIETLDKAFGKMLDSSPDMAQGLIDSLRQQAQELDHTSGRYRDNMELLDDWQGRLDDAVGASDALAGASGPAAEGVASVGDSAGDAKDQVEDLEAAYKRLLDLLGQRESYLGVQDDFDKIKQAAIEAYGAGATGAADAEQAQRDLEGAIIDTKQGIIDYLSSLGDVPESVATDILADIDMGKYDEAKRKLADLEKKRTVSYQVQIGNTSASSYMNPAALAQALGPNFNPQPVTVDGGGRTESVMKGRSGSASIDTGNTIAAAAAATGLTATSSGPTFEELLRQVEDLQSSTASATDAQTRLGTALADLDKKAKRGRTSAADLAAAQRAAFEAAIGSARANAEAAAAQATLDGKTFSAAQSAQMQADELGKLAGSLAPGSPLATNLLGYVELLGKVKQGHEDNSKAEEEAKKKSEEAAKAAQDRAQAMFDLAQANLDANRSTVRVTDATNDYVGALFSQAKTAEEAAQKTARIKSAEDALVDAVLSRAKATAERDRIAAAAEGRTLSTADLAWIQANEIGNFTSKMGAGAPRSQLEQYIAALSQVSGGGISIGTQVINGGSAAGVTDAMSQLLWRMRLGG